jgi:hypothetical protein
MARAGFFRSQAGVEGGAQGMGDNCSLASQWHKNCDTKNCFADFLNRA